MLAGVAPSPDVAGFLERILKVVPDFTMTPERWRERGGPRDHRLLARLVPDLGLELRAWAGDESLLFLEWPAHGRVAGAPFAVGVAERLELRGGASADARSYFDTLELAVRLRAAG
jgi:hypothetical protein